MMLPLLNLEETRAELAEIEDGLARMDDKPAVDVARREELRTRRLGWRDGLRAQVAELEAHDG
jgi:hypothetical protein